MAAKIKKGDRVVLLAGKDKGRTGNVTQVMPKESRVLVVGPQHGPAPHPPVPGRPARAASRHKEASRARLQRRHRRFQRQADPRRLPDRGWQEGPRGQDHRRGDPWLRPQTYEPRLKSDYRARIRPALKEKFGYTNEMQIPRLDKIVVNMGIGEAVADSKKAAAAMKDLAAITGQKPMPTKARTSIAGFKLREGMVIGAKVTLRKDRMYEFLDRLITIALPRVKDFRGLKPTSFDGRGNYAMGLREHIVFPEINYDEIDQIWGMDIIVCTTAKTDDEARALLKEFQFPFNA